MQRLAFSTDDVPEADRFAYWREAVSEGFFGVSGERDQDQETPFNGKIEGWIGGSVTRFRYRADRFRVLRRPRDIARRSGTIVTFSIANPASALGSTMIGASSSPGPAIWGSAIQPSPSPQRPEQVTTTRCGCCREGCSILTSRFRSVPVPSF